MLFFFSNNLHKCFFFVWGGEGSKNEMGKKLFYFINFFKTLKINIIYYISNLIQEVTNKQNLWKRNINILSALHYIF